MTIEPDAPPSSSPAAPSAHGASSGSSPGLNWTEKIALGLLRGGCRFSAILPLSWARGIGAALGRTLGFFARRHRRRALRHIAACLPGKSARERSRIIRDMFAGLGMNAMEMLQWMGGRRSVLSGMISVDGQDRWTRTLAERRGAGILTAHMGNWDLGGMWAASMHPLTIISKDIRSRVINRFWMEQRAHAGVRIVPAHHSYRQCLAALKRGDGLGFILDQNMIDTEGIFVDFFGRPACTSPGLALLSAHAQSPVLPMFIVRTRSGHCVKVGDPIPPPPDRNPATLAAFTQRYTSAIEDMVRQHPEQWIWMHCRWRTQPTDAPTSLPRRPGECICCRSGA